VNIGVKSNAAEVARWVREIRSDQAPYALSVAINATALQAQETQREHQRRIFTIRNPTFVDRSTKLKPRATKTSLFAVLQVDPPGGPGRMEIITRHEEDTVRLPFKSKSLIVPAAPVKSRRIIRRSDPLHPSKWGLKKVPQSGKYARHEVYRGNKGLYMIRYSTGGAKVYQRQGPGKYGTHEGSILLFRLRAKTALHPELNFVENITRVVEERWEDNIAEAWDKALRSAR